MPIQNRTPIADGPLWDSNTDEVVSAFIGAGTNAITVPDNCYAVWLSVDAAVECFVSPDGTDDDSGLRFGDAADPRVMLWVAAGTVLQLHAAGAVNVNWVRFYNKE